MSALPRNDTQQINVLLREVRRLELLITAGQGSENQDVQKRTMQHAQQRDSLVDMLYKRFGIVWPEF